MRPRTSKKNNKKSSQNAFDVLMKRRKTSDRGSPSSFPDDNRLNIPQVGPESSKQLSFDGFCDPKLDKARKQILNNVDNFMGLPNCSFVAKSDGTFYSKKSCSTVKMSSNNCTGSGFEVDFKTASGRPLVREVLQVASTNENNNAENSNKAPRYLGGKPFFHSKPILLPKSNAAEVADSANLQHKQIIGENAAGSVGVRKREGWKANECLKYFEDHIIDTIEAEIMSNRTDIKWSDIAGLEATKKALKEIIVLPFLRPDIFTGIRAPPKGVLLFGPPGTGKTMIGRCVASQCKATFFNIAASSVTSKWVGEGEKLVRALFAIARVLQPSVIFIDEVDSLLTSRNEMEHESSRRIKTEFLIHLDGVATTTDERILILGATNRPQELDPAAMRRFVKRLLIALPCCTARAQMIQSLLSDQKHELSGDDIQQIAKLTSGYSGADMKQLCAEAAMAPIRNVLDSSSMDIASISADDIRPIGFSDFEVAMQFVRPTVVEKDLEGYREWNRKYGSFATE